MMEIYNKLSECEALRNDLERFVGDKIDEDVMTQLVVHLIRTYCRMRGKDFCRQLMTTNFSNLGKGIRPTMAVLSDKQSYQVVKNEKKENESNESSDEYNDFSILTQSLIESSSDDDNIIIHI